jgi:hypothetical protein
MMNSTSKRKIEQREKHIPDWIWELLIVVTVTPAIIYGIGSVSNFPIV